MWDEAQTCFLEERVRPPLPASPGSRQLRRSVVALMSGWLGRGLEAHKQTNSNVRTESIHRSATVINLLVGVVFHKTQW